MEYLFSTLQLRELNYMRHETAIAPQPHNKTRHVIRHIFVGVARAYYLLLH